MSVEAMLEDRLVLSMREVGQFYFFETINRQDQDF